MPTTKEILLRELDRRIANVEKVSAWREKTARDYFDSFKSYVADNLTIDALSAGHLDSRIQETNNAYHCWALAEAELNQLKALKEDIEKGRVNLDA